MRQWAPGGECLLFVAIFCLMKTSTLAQCANAQRYIKSYASLMLSVPPDLGTTVDLITTKLGNTI